jgi:hypothetical protein
VEGTYELLSDCLRDIAKKNNNKKEGGTKGTYELLCDCLRDLLLSGVFSRGHIGPTGARRVSYCGGLLLDLYFSTKLLIIVWRHGCYFSLDGLAQGYARICYWPNRSSTCVVCGGLLLDLYFSTKLLIIVWRHGCYFRWTG